MAKWKSPIMSDIRNQLGQSVVFSIWKGRNYFRSYVIPANPRTNAQKGNRAVLKELVKRWQSIINTDAKRAAWNNEALPYLISGFNLFVKFGRKSAISCPSTGQANVAFNITYTLGLPASKARLFRYNGTTWTDITPTGGLSETPNSVVSRTETSAGTYYYFIADGDVLVTGDSAPQPYQAITKWMADETNGVAKEAKIVIS